MVLWHVHYVPVCTARETRTQNMRQSRGREELSSYTNEEASEKKRNEIDAEAPSGTGWRGTRQKTEAHAATFGKAWEKPRSNIGSDRCVRVRQADLL